MHRSKCLRIDGPQREYFDHWPNLIPSNDNLSGKIPFRHTNDRVRTFWWIFCCTQRSQRRPTSAAFSGDWSLRFPRSGQRQRWHKVRSLRMSQNIIFTSFAQVIGYNRVHNYVRRVHKGKQAHQVKLVWESCVSKTVSTKNNVSTLQLCRCCQNINIKRILMPERRFLRVG